jgi:hypothetical protein
MKKNWVHLEKMLTLLSCKLYKAFGLALAVNLGLVMVLVVGVLFAFPGNPLGHAHSEVNVGRGDETKGSSHGLQIQSLHVEYLEFQKSG